MTTYLGTVALAELHRAQAVIDDHLLVDMAGRCRTCGDKEPCPARQQAAAVFVRYGVLPKRTPGATRAGLRRAA